MAYRPEATDSWRFTPGYLYQIWHMEWPGTQKHLHHTIEDCVCEIILEESDRIISDQSLQVCIDTLTIAGVRPELQSRVNNSCIVFVQSLLGLVMKGGSGLSF